MKELDNRTFSIKKRLIHTILSALIFFLSIAIGLTYLFARHEIEEVYDAHLSQSAKMLSNFTTTLSNKPNPEHYKSLYNAWINAIIEARQNDIHNYEYHPYEQNFIFQIYHQGQLIWQSNSQHLTIEHNPLFSGFKNIQLNHQDWRLFQLPIKITNDPLTTSSYIIVAEKQKIRDEITNEIALSSAIPLLVLIPILLVIIIYLIDKNLLPLHTLKLAISQRHANKLDHIYLAHTPLELKSLVNTLNLLLSELEQAREREKRFTRMAAHELKTPLTILRLNAEHALSSQDQQTKSLALNTIIDGIDRTDRLMHQLLTLAKIEQLRKIDKKEIDIKTLITHEIAELAPLALRNNQEISFEGASAYLEAESILLPLLFKNLIDNAIRYSGENSKIEVYLTQSDTKIIIRIHDSGEIIPDEIKKHIFEHFYRGKQNNTHGSGLGMSIVQDIIELYKGTIEIKTAEIDNKIGNAFIITLPKLYANN